ncbi:D-aminoacyl-tRNA deacylase 1 isoform X3 [Phyllostomus hastatus]|uniref:D-aminoacyl-tRNA deacylase 1 isoform X3 n=1 Tax=Phyllostomus hastatus TaxID=9423 RepID=UPI001E67F78C|nr:D-aminoacyl-tRNA deacylase 1 isoform X3 [Phyllostomus hastatus]
MKAVVQRVARASVTVGGEQISAIGQGICVLLGISLEDTHKELEHMVRKILNLRVFEDESGKHWSKSVMDKQYEVLCVSQFTLQCVLKGNKPDFHLAMPTEQAENFYNSFLEQLRKAYRPELIKDGKFGAYMQVHIQNDGPVTIELESPAPSAATSDPKQDDTQSTVPHWSWLDKGFLTLTLLPSNASTVLQEVTSIKITQRQSCVCHGLSKKRDGVCCPETMANLRSPCPAVKA